MEKVCLISPASDEKLWSKLRNRVESILEDLKTNSQVDASANQSVVLSFLLIDFLVIVYLHFSTSISPVLVFAGSIWSAQSYNGVFSIHSAFSICGSVGDTSQQTKFIEVLAQR
jgi:hypothetical protein